MTDKQSPTLDELLGWSKTPVKHNICPIFDECSYNPRNTYYSCFTDYYEECPIYLASMEDEEK